LEFNPPEKAPANPGLFSWMTSLSVSVVLPARNAAATLGAAVASLRAQDLGDFEIVLVDHGSTDGTWALMGELARSDDRIRILRCEGTFVEAANLAWRTASGDLVARMDADDLAMPSRLRVQREFLSTHSELSGCATGVRIVKRTDSGERVPPAGGYRRYETWVNGVIRPGDIAAQRFIDSPLPNPTSMLRREVLEEVRGYGDPVWAEDYDLWLRLLERGPVLGKVPEILLEWIDGPTRATRSYDRYSLARFQEAKAHYLARLPRVRADGVVICGAGPTGKDMASRLRRNGIVIHAFLEVNVRQIGQRIGGVPVLASDRAPDFAGSAVMLAASGREPGREQIRSLLAGAGFHEGEDFFCVA
jgi:glycosyltransferase involved in cell wall biosynthesis